MFIRSGFCLLNNMGSGHSLCLSLSLFTSKISWTNTDHIHNYYYSLFHPSLHWFPKLVYYVLLRGNCTPNQNWACFVRYLKIINTVVKTNMIILKQIAWETQKRYLKLVGQAVLEMLIRICNILFWSTTQELLSGLLKF